MNATQSKPAAGDTKAHNQNQIVLIAQYHASLIAKGIAVSIDQAAAAWIKENAAAYRASMKYAA